MTRYTYSGKMQILGIILVAFLALGVFLGSRAEALLNVVQSFAGGRSSSTEAKVSSVHPADRKFANGNYEMESSTGASEVLVSGADRKFLDSGYLKILQEQMRVGGAIDAASVHPADRKLLNLGYLATVSGKSSDGENTRTIHPADRKFFTGPLSGRDPGDVPDAPTYLHPADRKFLHPSYVRGQTANGGK